MLHWWPFGNSWLFPLFYIIANQFWNFWCGTDEYVGCCSAETEVIGWCLVLTVTDQVVVRCEAATSRFGSWRYGAAFRFNFLSVFYVENDLIILL
jgi:hypothetical protein